MGVSLPSLTALRVPAALAVVLLHAEFFFARGGPVERAAHGLNAAVVVFFVLSGFVLTWGYRGRSVRDFYIGRFARIWPVHLLTMAAVLVLTPMVFGYHATTGNLWQSMLLVQAWFPHHGRASGGVNPVSWSLSVEILFYALLPALLTLNVWRSRWTVAVCVAWALACAGLSFYAYEVFSWPWLRFGEFGLGVILAHLVSDGWRPAARLRRCAWIGVAGWFAVASLAAAGGKEMPAGFTDFLVLPAACWWVASLATRDLAGRAPMAGHRKGRWAYSLFLTHYPLFSLAAYWWRPSGIVVQQASVLVAAIVATPVAAATYWLVERPVERQVMRKKSRVILETLVPKDLPNPT